MQNALNVRTRLLVYEAQVRAFRQTSRAMDLFAYADDRRALTAGMHYKLPIWQRQVCAICEGQPAC
jgi:hypothetical protein